jgi:XTP/dITP diphosphohydrolase
VRFVLATANAGKAREIADVLRGAGVDDLDLVPRPDGVPDVEETGTTLEDNARLKAVALCEATGLPAIADDTGLLVDALGGAPGVRSARFAGEDATDARNVAKLLDLLRDVDPDHRTARFATVALARFPDGREVAAFGDVEGTIAPEPRGESGFGYDPVFVPEEGDGRTFAQLSAEHKNSLSHRGRAFRTLADGLRMVAALEEQQ